MLCHCAFHQAAQGAAGLLGQTSVQSKHGQWSLFHWTTGEFVLTQEISRTVFCSKIKKKKSESNHQHIFSSSSAIYLLHNVSNIESISRGKSHMD